MLTDFAEIWWLICNLTSQCWRRISLKSDVVCQSYGNVYRGAVFSWTRCSIPGLRSWTPLGWGTSVARSPECRVQNVIKGKGRYSSWEPHLIATGRHLPFGITQCYLPRDTSERAPPNPSHAGRYSIYLPRRDGRLSWHSWLDSAPAGSQTTDLSITSLTPNRCTTKSLN